ncbi:MAG TPA: hypothetical protein GX702_14935 [Chloroflexi bacterium]|nr:hypothetical protein [Chloroflexota bacterium]
MQASASVSLRRSIALRRIARLPVTVTLFLLLVTSIPTVLGYLTVPEDRWFSGVVYNVHDTAQYYSWMREYGRSMLIENRLTPEISTPVYFNLHWWIPGRSAALLGLSLVQIYQISRLLYIPLAIAATYLFCTHLFDDTRRAHYAFLLTTFTSGMGWIWVVKKYLTSSYTLEHPQDVYTLGGNSFWVMVAAPHLVLALAATFFTLLLALKGLRAKGWGLTLASGLAALFLAMGHIYDLVTVWGVLGMFGLLLTLRDGWSWRVAGRLATVVLMSLPAVLYWGWVVSDANPIWKQALAQYDNLGVFTPNPLHLLILLGIPFVLSLATYNGIVPLQRQSDEQLFIKGWLIITPLLAYLPLRFQITLLNGYQLPIAVMATWGLYNRVLPWLRHRLPDRKRIANWLPALLLLAVLPTNLYLLSWRIIDLQRNNYPYYIHQEDLAAMRWLELNAHREDIVLSSFEIGHYIPGFTGIRPYLSNAVMTMDSHRRRGEVMAFYSSETSEAERQDLLRHNNIRYVFYGPAERALGGFPVEEWPILRPVYIGNETRLYEVNLP